MCLDGMCLCIHSTNANFYSRTLFCFSVFQYFAVLVCLCVCMFCDHLIQPLASIFHIINKFPYDWWLFQKNKMGFTVIEDHLHNFKFIVYGKWHRVHIKRFATSHTHLSCGTKSILLITHFKTNVRSLKIHTRFVRLQKWLQTIENLPFSFPFQFLSFFLLFISFIFSYFE